MNIPEYRQTVREAIVDYEAGGEIRTKWPDGTSTINSTIEIAEAQILQATKELFLSLVGEDLQYPPDAKPAGFVKPYFEGQNALRKELRNAVAEMGEK